MADPDYVKAVGRAIPAIKLTGYTMAVSFAPTKRDPTKTLVRAEFTRVGEDAPCTVSFATVPTTIVLNSTHELICERAFLANKPDLEEMLDFNRPKGGGT
jgi:hypothetical protein